MRHGRPGQKYIFATQYLTFDEVIDLFAPRHRTDSPALALAVPA